MTVGEKIKMTRIERGFTQKQLGEMCGINEANIRKYESGRQNPKIETVRKIADVLGVDPFVLVTLESYPKERYAKSLDYAEPIYKYLHSIGYSIERETEAFRLGELTGKKGTGNIILKSNDGKTAVFSKEEFRQLQSNIKEVIDTKFYKKLMEQQKPPE